MDFEESRCERYKIKGKGKKRGNDNHSFPQKTLPPSLTPFPNFVAFHVEILFNTLRKFERDFKNEIITLKSYLKQDNPTHNIFLFQLDFNEKFPLLRLLQLLSDG